MSAKRIYTISDLPKSDTDWTTFANLTEKMITTRAKNDPDASPLSAKQLKKFKRVVTPENLDIEIIRKKIGLSQAAFAACFGISKRTLQEWEQGRRQPKATARVLLAIINYEPAAIQRALLHHMGLIAKHRK